MSGEQPEPGRARAAPPRAAEVDIGALLGVALGPPPPDDFSERVGTKVTLMTTATELALLVLAAPFDWLRDDPSEDARDST